MKNALLAALLLSTAPAIAAADSLYWSYVEVEVVKGETMIETIITHYFSDATYAECVLAGSRFRELFQNDRGDRVLLNFGCVPATREDGEKFGGAISEYLHGEPT